MPRANATIETAKSAKPVTATAMEAMYRELEEELEDIESTEDLALASSLSDSKAKLADAYFWKFIHPQIAGMQTARA